MSSGDYSYGIFLYGFVVQQCVATFGDPVRYWSLNFLISLPISFAVAFVSWLRNMHFGSGATLNRSKFSLFPGSHSSDSGAAIPRRAFHCD